MSMDWVPCFNYGQEQFATVFAQTDLPLMDPLDFASADVAGKIEGNPNRYFVHRIVGQISIVRDVTPVGNQHMVEVIWPGLIDDPQAGTVATAGLISVASGVNSRLWHIRQKRVQSVTDFFDLGTDAQRWYSHIDITPKQVVDDGQIPVLSYLNNATAGQGSVYVWLRLLLSPIS